MFNHFRSGILAVSVIATPALADTITFSSADSPASSIPTLGTSMLILLSVILGLIAAYMIRKHPGSGLTPVITLLLAGAVFSSTGGIISHAVAQQIPENTQVITNPSGGTFSLELGINRFQNNSGAPLRVIKIDHTGNSCVDIEPDQCKEGSTLVKGASCEVLCYGGKT